MKRYNYSFSGRHGRLRRRLAIIGAVLLLAIIIGGVLVQRSYRMQLRPVGEQYQKVYITIASGTPPSDIAELLHDKGVIRSVDAFVWYVTSHNERDKLQAGTYLFSPSFSTGRIADEIAHGSVATDLVTILPGQTLSEIRKSFIESGFNVNAVDAALQVSNYQNLPALADNPSRASLEGFLYPDSYQKDATTDPKQIVEESLDEMQAHLTSDVRAGFAAHNLTVYQGVTLSSVVEKEVSNQSDRNQVAQVFLKRLAQGIRLGSDVTVLYSKSINDSSYDTTANGGLPPGPIAAVSDSSLKAVAHPAGTDWLYFVTGDDGTTYFSHTYQEHQANVAKYCHKLCSQP